MRLSAKGRYALAATTYLAQHYANNEHITVAHISESLHISKIYLEQVFSLLKKGQVVYSIKGSHGGYRLTRPPHEICIYDILAPIESVLFEPTKTSTDQSISSIEFAIQQIVFQPLDNTLCVFLKSITLDTLAHKAHELENKDNYMYYI